MKHKRLSSDGFHVVGILLLIVVIAVIGFVGYKVTQGGQHQDKNTPTTPSPEASVGEPTWKYNQEKLAWEFTGGKAPVCKEPLLFDAAPVDMSKVAAVGLPGAYRGFDYKAHGGFRLSTDTDGYAEISMPMDAKLMSIKRYYELGELQYLVDFETDCGIAFRFDHLHTLAPAFQEYADKTPEPKKDDTRGNPNVQPINKAFKSGDVIATRVGFPAAANYGFDFGVYDYRQRNEIAKDKKWAEIHKQYSAQHYHGVCWLPMLPAANAQRAEALAKDRTNYNSSKPFNLTSDYCTDIAPHKTLEFNNGLPTEG